MNRRQFLATSSAAALRPPLQGASPVDFRYAPLAGQTTICFPDDPYKTLVGESGDLRYQYTKRGIAAFGATVEFSLRGMEEDRVVKQWLEAPETPIVHTLIERPAVFLELTAFATNRPDEGRVDNVIAEVRPKSSVESHASMIVTVRTRFSLAARSNGGATVVELDGQPFCIADCVLARPADAGAGWTLVAPVGTAAGKRPLRHVFRFPQAGQKLGASPSPEELLAEARESWRKWKPFAGSVGWTAPGRYGEFLTACARNILQAREVRDGRLTFQVGPTTYRGLWVVDGHFILEAARYLGYDAEAQQGLEATWARQDKEGGIFAGAGTSHWKDTGIAMFSLVRQAELSQEWSYFRKMQPEVLRAIGYLRKLQATARGEDSACGKYGLLPKGMGDGGLGGRRSEFTNTLWALAGLKAVVQSAQAQKISGFEGAGKFYQELNGNCFRAMRQEMRRHPAGFDYLPMLMKEDPQWQVAAEWDRPRPQVAQWALSHAIYPGLLFARNDPVVEGHIRLMRACAQEGIPAETGWLPHEGVWNYNAAFVAHVYLWAGLKDLARATFDGFLNHATPLYCWREEQPVRGSAVAGYIGDMPHNWASAECVLLLRHLLALEDGNALRLLPGLAGSDGPSSITGSPTRFGRISLRLERGHMEFTREPGPAPALVELPALRHFRCQGAKFTAERSRILIEPGAAKWSATWRA